MTLFIEISKEASEKYDSTLGSCSNATKFFMEVTHSIDHLTFLPKDFKISMRFIPAPASSESLTLLCKGINYTMV